MTWTRETSKGNESQKCRWEIVQYTRGRGLDVGCGPIKCFPHFIGVDNCHHEMFGQHIKPDIRVQTCLDLGVFATESMDFVFSSHTLEHVQPADVVQCLNEWCRVIKRDGHMVLYLPDEDEYPKMGEDGANPDHKFNVNYDVVVDAMKRVDRDWDLVEFQKRNQDDEYSLLFVFRMTNSAIRN